MSLATIPISATIKLKKHGLVIEKFIGKCKLVINHKWNRFDYTRQPFCERDPPDIPFRSRFEEV